jgi:hypothetical protein
MQATLDPFEDCFSRINSLMGYLRNIKQAGKLRAINDLEPVSCNAIVGPIIAISISYFASGTECLVLQQLFRVLTE